MSVVGPGLLTLPFAFKTGGFLVAQVVLILTAGTVCFTGELLLICHEATGHSTFDDLAREAFGPKGAIIIPVSNFIAIFGACTGYSQIILTDLDNLGWPKAISSAWGSAMEHHSLQCGLVLFAAVILPLCLLRDISSLRHSSMLGFVSALYLVTAVIIEACNNNEKHPGKMEAAIVGNGISTAAALMSFAFVLHLNIIPTFGGLKGTAKTITRMRHVVRGVVLSCLIVYTTIGFIGYNLYRDDTKDNVLHNLEDGSMTYAARTSMVLVTICAFPLLFFPLRMTMHLLLFGQHFFPLPAGAPPSERGLLPCLRRGPAAYEELCARDSEDESKEAKGERGDLAKREFITQAVEVLVLLVVVLIAASEAKGLDVVFGLTGSTVVVGIIYGACSAHSSAHNAPPLLISSPDFLSPPPSLSVPVLHPAPQAGKTRTRLSAVQPN
jgi:amino acid permease